MLPLDFVTDFVHEHFENVQITKNGSHFLARCTLCGDSKKSKSKRRFNMQYNNGSPFWHCWNCGQSGNFTKLFAFLKGMDEEEALNFLKSRYQRYNGSVIQDRLKKKDKQATKEKPKVVTYNYIVRDCIDETTKTDGYQQMRFQDTLKRFREKRNIPPDFKLYIAIRGDYKSRIIIPIIEDGNIVYFQGRRTHKDDIKYKNPPTEKRNIILNKNKFDRDKFIIVAEGLLDASAIGDQGTSCLGKEINEEFVEELLKLTDKGVILALDNDEDGQEYLKKYLLNGKVQKNVKYFVYPEKIKKIKDLNSLSSLLKNLNIYDFVTKNSYTRDIARVRLMDKR